MIKDFDFNYWENSTKTIAEAIDADIGKAINGEKRKQISQSVLSHIRNLIEHVLVLSLLSNECISLEKEYDYIKKAIKRAKGISSLRFLCDFYDEIEMSSSHYTLPCEQSERLLLKYIEKLISLKIFCKDNFNLEILNNIDKFPLNLDSTFEEYYKSIVQSFNSIDDANNFVDLFYVRKKKMIFCNGIRIFEYALVGTSGGNSRFDSFTVFSKIDVFENYAIRAKLVKRTVNIFDKLINLHFLVDYDVHIRKCEFDKLYKILKLKPNFDTGLEYHRLMDLLKESHKSLVYYLTLENNEYDNFIKVISNSNRKTNFLIFLETARKFLMSSGPGSNTFRYLLYVIENERLKWQLTIDEEESLNPEINLTVKDKMFDLLPFSFSLRRHNPGFDVLNECFGVKDHLPELMRRRIMNLCTERSALYLNFQKDFETDDMKLISSFNSLIEENHLSNDYKIGLYGNNVFFFDYEKATVQILEKFSNLSRKPSFNNFSQYANAKLEEFSKEIDDEVKLNALKRMYSTGDVFVVYGSAGTGKTTFAKYVVKLFGANTRILCLTSTNPALKNIKDKIGFGNIEYKTIYSCSKTHKDLSCDLLIIDECSTISNDDLLRVLRKVKYRLVLLLGDIYQIESIKFGNWFSISKYFLPKSSWVELNTEHRSKNNSTLVKLWNAVRNNDSRIEELIEKYRISAPINNSLFEKTSEDEIVLCLNYDGLYGINNINNYLQECNPSVPHHWKQYTFKLGDPILFIENKRFGNILHNNLKGVIKDIKTSRDGEEIEFYILVDKVLNSFTDAKNGLKIHKIIDNQTLISFIVKKIPVKEYENDSDNECQIPFQIAYAVSIHKAQGLEYESVKIVITNEVDELITHNIFYTAITRAKENLTIFWTPEVERKVINSLAIKSSESDAYILSCKYPELKLAKD